MILVGIDTPTFPAPSPKKWAGSTLACAERPHLTELGRLHKIMDTADASNFVRTGDLRGIQIGRRGYLAR